MLSKLDKRYIKLEKQRAELLGNISQFSESQLMFHPGPEQWSIAEIIHHLILVEQGTCLFIKRQLSFEKIKKRSQWRARFNSMTLSLFLASPFRFKAPLPNIIPQEPCPLDELQHRWEEAQKELSDILQRFTPEIVAVPIFKNPFVGYLNIIQTLQFIENHRKRHIKQIRRVQKSNNFPDINYEFVNINIGLL